MLETPRSRLKIIDEEMLFVQVRIGIAIAFFVALLFVSVNEIFYSGNLTVRFEVVLVVCILLTLIFRYWFSDWKRLSIEAMDLRKEYKLTTDIANEWFINLLCIGFLQFLLIAGSMIMKVTFVLTPQFEYWRSPELWLLTCLMYPVFRNGISSQVSG
jgi:hypothetical protein